MVLVYIIHDKGKLLTIVDPFSRHFELKILPPFFENTEILRRDVQVLDHILTMKIPPMPGQAGLLYRWDLQAEGGRRLSTVCKYQKAGSTMGNNILSDCIQYSTYVIIRNVFKTIYDVYISYFKLSFYITILFRNNVIPPANPNGKGGMVAQAFAVVIVGLCTVKRIINIKWGFISIVNGRCENPECRNITEYGGISRNMPEYHGIWRNITIFSRNIPEHHNIFRL